MSSKSKVFKAFFLARKHFSGAHHERISSTTAAHCPIKKKQHSSRLCDWKRRSKNRDKSLSPSRVCASTQPACVRLGRTQTVPGAMWVLQTSVSWTRSGKLNRHLSDTSPESMLAPPARCCFLPLEPLCYFSPSKHVEEPIKSIRSKKKTISS